MTGSWDLNGSVCFFAVNFPAGGIPSEEDQFNEEKRLSKFHLLTKPCTYFHVRLTDGAARIISTSYAATGNRNHISSVAPLLGTLIQVALPTELPQQPLSNLETVNTF